MDDYFFTVLHSRSETGSVGIWSLDEALRKVEECRNFSITSPDANTGKEVPRDTSALPLFTFKGHQVYLIKLHVILTYFDVVDNEPSLFLDCLKRLLTS